MEKKNPKLKSAAGKTVLKELLNEGPSDKSKRNQKEFWEHEQQNKSRESLSIWLKINYSQIFKSMCIWLEAKVTALFGGVFLVWRRNRRKLGEKTARMEPKDSEERGRGLRRWFEKAAIQTRNLKDESSRLSPNTQVAEQGSCWSTIPTAFTQPRPKQAAA